MTKSGIEVATGERGSRCAWCQQTLVSRSGPGRPRRFCRQGCRQQAYLARKTASGVGVDQQLVDRRQLEELQDRVELLRQALADLDRERARGELADLSQAFDWIRSHASEVTSLRLDPATRPESPGGGR